MLPTPTGLILWRLGGSMNQSSLFRSSGKWRPVCVLRGRLAIPPVVCICACGFIVSWRTGRGSQCVPPSRIIWELK